MTEKILLTEFLLLFSICFLGLATTDNDKAQIVLKGAVGIIGAVTLITAIYGIWTW